MPAVQCALPYEQVTFQMLDSLSETLDTQVWKKEIIPLHKQAEQTKLPGVSSNQNAVLQSDLYSQLEVSYTSLQNTARHSSEMANDWRLCDVERR